MSDNIETKVAEIIAERTFGPGFKTIADLRAMPPPDWNVEGYFEANSTAIFWGLPGSLKTTVVINWRSLSTHQTTNFEINWFRSTKKPGSGS